MVREIPLAESVRALQGDRPQAPSARTGTPSLPMIFPIHFLGRSKSKRLCKYLILLAGELGFEPRQTESESVVLPLHHSPKSLAESNNYRICLQRRRKEFFDPAEGEPFYSFSP